MEKLRNFKNGSWRGENNKMDWIQFVVFCIATTGLFFWNRSESRNDIRHMDIKLEANRNLMLVIHSENRTLIEAIKEEMKDFHGKLERIDAEFKGNMLLMEEKIRK